MAGGAGCEWYFGYRYEHNDLNCEDWRSREQMWKQTRIALDFFQKQLPFTRMRAVDSLVSSREAYCFAEPGEVYAVYLPDAEAARLEVPAGKYRVSWYNPRTGGELEEGGVQLIEGPGEIGLGLPPDEIQHDWVVLVRRIQDLE